MKTTLYDPVIYYDGNQNPVNQSDNPSISYMNEDISYKLIYAINDFIHILNITDYSVNADAQKGFATIKYRKDNLQYFTVIQPDSPRCILDNNIAALDDEGFTQEEIASRVCVSQGTVSNHLRYLRKKRN